jgi:two-component system sensor histidine kinase RpfC
MNVDFIEGVLDRTDKGLRSVLLAQARVRLGVAIPVIVADLVLYFVTPGGVPLWFLGLTAGYVMYALTPYWLMRTASAPFLQMLLVASAVSDPLVLSVWIALTGHYGSLIAGFYLFTTLGFGFRTGRYLMHLCQIVSIADFTLVLASTPYWQEHSVVWVALLIPLIVVPLYAGTLIKTLQESREHAERQSRAKSDLLAKVSHELRTPLTGIVSAAELLSLESNDRRVTGRTDTILSLSANLLSEINDLLDEAKYESTGIRLDPKPVDLHQLGERLRKTFETMAQKKHIAVQVTVAPDITDSVGVDAHHLNRVLLNLLGNAVKFTDQGSVRASIDLVEHTPDRYRLRFSVTDTGIGIPQDFHDKLFQPFTQVDQGTNRRYGGTGLGLALSKKAVDSMGGDLRCESEAGKGCRFWFELELPRTGPIAPTRSSIADGDRPAPMRVLLAEDNHTSAVLIQELLNLDHHEVAICDSGIGALELLAREKFDVLLLDYNLGDMDGVQVLKTYRFGRPQPAPTLFLTADATRQTAARLMEAGAAGILYKPVSAANLRDALARLQDSTVAPALTAPREPSGSDVARFERPTLRVVPVSPLDENILEELRSVSNSSDFLGKLLAHAEADITRSCQRLSDALADRSYAAVPNIAHALKGVSANIGAVRLATLAGSLLSMSSEELESSGDRLAADLRECTRATVDALRAVTASAASSVDDASALHLD